MIWVCFWRLFKTLYLLIIVGIGCDWRCSDFLLTLSLFAGTSFHSLELLFLESWFISLFVMFPLVFTTLLTALEFIPSCSWIIFLAELSSWRTVSSVCWCWTQHLHSVNPFTFLKSLVAVPVTNLFTTASTIFTLDICWWNSYVSSSTAYSIKLCVKKFQNF